MKRNIVLKVKDLEFEKTRSSVDEAYERAVSLLKLKGYNFNGVLLSVDKGIAYAWSYSKPKPKPRPRRGYA